MKSKTYPYVMTAFAAAIIAVLAQITIPLPLVPITGQTLAIGLVVTILGTKYGTLSVLVYILLGAIGMPVFSGFSGGFAVLVGPTGGYIVGFLVQALVMGIYMDKLGYNYVQAIISNLLGMIVTLSFGTIWLKILANISWEAAFFSGVAPFIVVGIIKAIIAAWVGIMVRNRLTTAKLLQQFA
ncbi:biotin synthase [Ureibacillus massiliensis 4400831 = CIP 108448 = CCUG 49529]|uniref:Biotin transporter n=1 Tax=Ureibacillus massiliensis 4400831 = CIP 108448 = CCUG 49529 TaxID=1211035 RepID=A0A0A3J2Q5_9BACL|nr:biotin transporter BioY [Ureibacillus massiliensis]KGR90015.1 biotin synthase [Ureibacillus massiliensis 4400831 = CIP 108448 = CCUG 49529]